jgi:hypothetical protein
VAEPGMWHLRKEADGSMEFVHRRTGEVLVFGAPTPASKCTSRPDCPCQFCVRVRAEIAEGRSEKDKENQLAEDFLRSYLQTYSAKPRIKKAKMPKSVVQMAADIRRAKANPRLAAP